MLCGYPHLIAVASLLIFWRCPRPCLLASRLALPTFALPLAMRLSDRQNDRSKLLTRSRVPPSWPRLGHRTGPTPNRMSKPVTHAHLRQRAKHQPLTSNRAAKSWQCLLIRSRAWGSWQSLAHRARRGLELVQLPSCGDDRQSLLAMCVDVESFRYEAQSAAASAVGLGACAWCMVRGHVRWQCLAHWRCQRLV